MHELSLIGSVLGILEQQAAAEHFKRVTKVCLGVGALSNVEIQSLRFCFAAARKGSLAGDAELSILTIPGEGWCEHCKRTVHIGQRFDSCPFCGAWGLSVTDGDKIIVMELEVE